MPIKKSENSLRYFSAVTGVLIIKNMFRENDFMKKTVLKTVSLLLMFILLCSCAREEFMDLYGFTERFTYTDIDPEDFFTEKNADGEVSFYCFFEKDNPRIMLKLFCNKENKINEIRIYFPKYDENGNKTAVTTGDISLFISLVSSSLIAFTACSKAEAEDIINQMQLYEKKSYENDGELTKTKNNYHFIYHSAFLGSEFTIYNTYLKAVPETLKPESKPMYGDTTRIRTETVPTK